MPLDPIFFNKFLNRSASLTGFLGICVSGVLFALLYRDPPATGVGTPDPGAQVSSRQDVSASGDATTPAEDSASTSPASEAEELELYPRSIDGIGVAASATDPFPFAVMIENHADARPPAGLSKANVVYEAEAEGGITRFLAVFASGENIEKIGPVRSARSYFVDWADEYSALYVHCGGSPQALSKIKAEGIFDFNEYSRGRYFWRDRSRRAPHNLYTSSANIGGYLEGSGKEKGDYTGWRFGVEPGPDRLGTTTSVTIPYHRSGYSVRWDYDRNANSYSRFHGGARHKDEDGSPITAKNLVIQYVKRSILDDEGRIALRTYGSGEAKIFINGGFIEGSWTKDKAKNRTFFYDADDQDIEFIPGSLWIEVIPSWYEVQVK